MNNNYQNLYWLTRVDGINGLVLALGVICLVACFLIPFVCMMTSDFDSYKEDDEIKERKATRAKYMKKTKWLLPLGFFFILCRIMIPSQKDIVLIIAGGKTIDFIQTDTSVSKIPSQTTAIISQFLNNQIINLQNPKDTIVKPK